MDWPTITVPVSFGDLVQATADFELNAALSAGNWKVKAIVVGVPNLQLAPRRGAARRDRPRGNAHSAGRAVYRTVPCDCGQRDPGDDCSGRRHGFSRTDHHPVRERLEIPIYDQPQIFEVLPAEGPVDPKVDVTIDSIAAAVAHNVDEDELVLTAAISA